MLVLAGGAATMAGRIEPTDSLDDFPTPPWATRALFEIVFKEMGLNMRHARVWEPACNRGLMAEVIKEYARDCFASDVHDYGYGDAFGSFTGSEASLGLDIILSPDKSVHLVATNPPFCLAQEFLERALHEAPLVALLLPTRWVEGVNRYNDVLSKTPPTMIAYFVERVPIHKGRWDPEGDTATSYSWFVWKRDAAPMPPMWIPPGQRLALSRDYDVKRAYELGALGEDTGTLL